MLPLSPSHRLSELSSPVGKLGDNGRGRLGRVEWGSPSGSARSSPSMASTSRSGVGEFLSLLGPSGCGKTTTLRMLAGFEEPDAGEIRISGVDVRGVPPYRRDVNTVFQNYALFPAHDRRRECRLRPSPEGLEKKATANRVGYFLEMVQMTRFAQRKPRELSGGQQQRVALARALVNQPSLLLLDEPLGALDRKLRQEMQIELKLLQTQLGITFIYVTHDQEEALSMSDRIAVMLDGHIEQLDDPDEIYDRPASAFVAGFIGQQNFFPGQIKGDGFELDRRRMEDPGAATGRRRQRRPARDWPRSAPNRSRSTAVDPGRRPQRRPRASGRHRPPRRRHPARGAHRRRQGDPQPAPAAAVRKARSRPGGLVLLDRRARPDFRKRPVTTWCSPTWTKWPPPASSEEKET